METNSPTPYVVDIAEDIPCVDTKRYSIGSIPMYVKLYA